jgi:K+-transporting ATPase KdpF subunit
VDFELFVGALLSASLCVYLVVALLRPERF